MTVDTLRADHLGCYGFEDKLISPNIDRVAQRGVLFDDAMATIGKTGPAFASMFTSEYPPVTGARRNGIRMRPDIPALAGLLKRAGYATAAIVSNWTVRNKLSGLARGFDFYDDRLPETRRGPIARERDADDVTSAGIEWLEKNTPQPFFLWIHYSDPHAPYEQHENYQVQISRQSADLDGAKKRMAYASEVRYSDHWIGKFIEAFLARMRSDSTVMLFLSDHGESLGEHDCWGHGKNVMQPNLRIPLVIVGSGFPAGTRSRVPVSVVDILPTILRAAGVEALPPMKGVPIQDLLVKGNAVERCRYAFADKGLSPVRHQTKNYTDPLAICLMQGEWKIVWEFGPQKVSRFHRVLDPGEVRPVSEESARNRAPGVSELMKWYEALPKYEARKDTEIEEEDLKQLKSLGYVGD